MHDTAILNGPFYFISLDTTVSPTPLVRPPGNEVANVHHHQCSRLGKW